MTLLNLNHLIAQSLSDKAHEDWPDALLLALSSFVTVRHLQPASQPKGRRYAGMPPRSQPPEGGPTAWRGLHLDPVSTPVTDPERPIRARALHPDVVEAAATVAVRAVRQRALGRHSIDIVEVEDPPAGAEVVEEILEWVSSRAPHVRPAPTPHAATDSRRCGLHASAAKVAASEGRPTAGGGSTARPTYCRWSTRAPMKSQ